VPRAAPSFYCIVLQPVHENHAIIHLVDTVGLSHGALEVQSLDVLPVLLQERHQEIDGNLHVGIHLHLLHLDVGASGTHGEHLLELELDGAANGVDLLDHVLSLLDESRELTHLVHGRSQKTRDLLHDSGRGEEEAVPVGELLDLLLVLVETLESLDIHARDASGLSLVDVEGISEDAARHVWPRDVGQLDRTSETLVLLCVVVLQHDLELNGLHELALLVSGSFENVRDGLLEGISWDF